MAYDNYGNITAKNGKTYTYDSIWKDLLTSYNGQSITYDAQGNPLSYLGHTLTWENGRQLKSYDSNTYTYNANGIRTSKTIGVVKLTYMLDGAKIQKETWGENTLTTLWDNEDSLCGIRYADESYFFLKNLQGDIIAIADKDGVVVARYSYDAWGVCTIVSDTSGVNIATVNPFRYRGYYYDAETHLYYLQSRYYNPVVGRFVNVDDIKINIALSENTIYNLYTYCKNNPVNYSDPTGYSISIAVLVIALLLIGVVGGLISVAALHETESYKRTISGGKFLRTAVEFMLGFVQGIFTVFYLLLMGIGALVFALGLATSSALKEWKKCKGKLSASVFNQFVDSLTQGLMSTIIGEIIKLAFTSKNIYEFVKGLIEGWN